MKRLILLGVIAALFAGLLPATPAVADGTCTVVVTLKFVSGPRPKAIATADCNAYHSMAVTVILWRWVESDNAWREAGRDHKEEWFDQHLTTNYLRDSTCNPGTKWFASGWLYAYDLPGPDPTPHNPDDMTGVRTC